MRAMSLSNILKMKHTTYDFESPWSEAMGTNPSDNGIWLVWGKEKNGKSWMCLLLAKYLAQFRKVLYVSAEEGLGKEFVDAIRRAGLTPKEKNLSFVEYESINEIRDTLRKRNAPHVVLLDNLTVYNGDLTTKLLNELTVEFPTTHFVLVAHEERGEPVTALAKHAKRMAKVIIHVKGLKANVSGRCKGGTLVIDDEQASLYYGAVKQQQDDE